VESFWVFAYTLVGGIMEENLMKFKEYVKKNPEFISAVKKGETTWQSLYELYTLYGEDETAFSKYLISEEKHVPEKASPSFMESLMPVIESLKGMDVHTVQKGIESLQKGIGLVQELIGNKDTTTPTSNYTPRPVGKYFDD